MAVLPPELLIEVIKYNHDDVGTLKSLSQINSMFHDISAEFLFEKVVLSESLVNTINKLETLSKRSAEYLTEPARYVKELTILRSAGTPEKYLDGSLKRTRRVLVRVDGSWKGGSRGRADGSTETSDAFDAGCDLYKPLLRFVAMAGRSLTNLTIDFADERGAGTEFNELAPARDTTVFMTIDMASILRSIDLPRLSKLTANHVHHFNDFIRVATSADPAVDPDKKPGGNEKAPKTLAENLKRIKTLDIGFKGMFYGHDCWRIESPHKIITLVAEKTVNVTDLSLSFTPHQPTEILRQKNSFLTTQNDNLVSLSLAGINTFGLDTRIKNCHNLKKISLSCIFTCPLTYDVDNHKAIGTGWTDIFDTCRELQHLRTLNVDRLMGDDDEPCFRERRALAWTDEKDVHSLEALVSHVLSHDDGVVTQGPDGERVWHWYGLRLCRHAR